MRISISIVNVSTLYFMSASCPILYSLLRYHVLLNEILRVIRLLDQIVTVSFGKVPFKQINYVSSVFPESTFKPLVFVNKVIVNLLHRLLDYLVLNLFLSFRSLLWRLMSVCRVLSEKTFAFWLLFRNWKLALGCWGIAKDFILSFVVFFDESKIFIKV